MMNTNENNRLTSETEFHDRRFREGDKHRGDVTKYYTAAEQAKQAYGNIIRSMCNGKRILEYGCGAESQFATWEACGAIVTGIDISAEAVRLSRELAAAKSSKANFEVMNAEDLKFAGGSFDLVVGTGILHHLDLGKSYAEIRRVLAVGGTAVFFEPMGHNPAIKLYRHMTPSIRTPDEHPLLMSDVLWAKQYFGEVQAKFYVLTTLIAVPFRSWRIGRTINQILLDSDRLLLTVFPFLRRYCWIVVLELKK
jgi:SAM-dependent methyltransferase